MIEIEKRVLLNKKESSRFLDFLKQNAKFVHDFKRFAIVQLNNSDFTPDPKGLTDIKVRTTKEGGKFVVKYGNWHAESSREEYEVNFKNKDIVNLMNILCTLGYKYFVTTYKHRHEFVLGEFTITLDEFYSVDAHLVEVEILVKNKSQVKKATNKINDLLKEHNMRSLDSKGMIDFIQSQNNVKKLRVDFTKTTVEKWYKKWKDYIYCLK